jgi:hypothetical protein
MNLRPVCIVIGPSSREYTAWRVCFLFLEDTRVRDSLWETSCVEANLRVCGLHPGRPKKGRQAPEKLERMIFVRTNDTHLQLQRLASRLPRNDPFAFTKSDPHREHRSTAAQGTAKAARCHAFVEIGLIGNNRRRSL